MNQIQPYQIALHHAGLKEIAGKKHNPIIIQMFNDLGFDGDRLGDETSWCSLFACWCNKTAGFQHPGKLYANSWTEFDGVKKVEEPVLGDIVVFWRGRYNGDPIPGTNIPKRHVAYFMNHDLDIRYENVLGGNQSNMVKISKYLRSRVIGYYRPILKPTL